MVITAAFDIHDAQTGAAIAGAAVALVTDSGSVAGATTTGADGRAVFVVEGGVYTLTMRARGYADGSLAVLLDRDTEIGPSIAPLPPAPAPGAPGGAAGGDVPGSSGSVIAVAAPAPINAPPLPPVQFVDVDGVPHIRPEFFVPPELGGSAGPILLVAVAAIDVIATLFGGPGGGGSDTSTEQQEIKTLQASLAQLGIDVVNGVYASLAREGEGVGLFGKVLGGILGPLINAVATLFGKLHTDLGKLFAPLVDFLKKLRAQLQHLYDVWLKPILQVIDAFRQFLKILEFFHVQWATTLDNALGALERKLTAPILYLQGKINELLNAINNIVGLDGLFNRVLLLQSLVKNAGAAFNALLQPSLATVNTAKTKQLLSTEYAETDPRELVEGLTDTYEDNGGAIAGFAGELVSTWRVAAGLDAFKGAAA